MNHDTELLRRFVDDRSEAAFTNLVQRHVGLVYHTALRRVGGDVQHAEDVTQTVFVALARHAPQLVGHTALGGWLFVTAQHASAELVRREQRRKTREATAQAMHLSDQPDVPVPAADPLRPVLDDALMSLPADDRDAIVLRFFEQRSFADVGQALQLSEDAARKRVGRSLDKLHDVLRRRGIVTVSAALGGALTAAGAGPAPTGLALQVAAHAFTHAGAHAAVGASLISTLLPAAAIAALVAGVFVVGPQHRANEKLAAEIAGLERQNQAMPVVQAGLARETREQIDLPDAAPAPVTSPAPSRPVPVTPPPEATKIAYVSDEGAITWDGKQVTLDACLQGLSQHIATRPADARVVIKTGEHTRFPQLLWMIDETRKAGIEHLVIESQAKPWDNLPLTWF
jgi:RNA polymerase sigma factor (sigma-70 family)